MPLGDVAFPTAVIIQVHGHAKRRIAAGDSADREIIDPGVIPAHVKLKNPVIAERIFGDFL